MLDQSRFIHRALHPLVEMVSEDTLRNKLLADIQNDTDSLCISSTSVSASTVYGLNTVSGRAIMAVGYLAIQAVERVNMKLALRRISSELPHNGANLRGDIRPRLLEDLLELQRPGLYPSSIRHEAWKLIARYLVQRRSHELVEAIFRAKWPRIELQIFVRQMAILELQEWRLLPHPFQDSPISRSTQYANAPDPLLEGVYTIILGILDRDPASLHGVFTFEEFVHFISGHDCDQIKTYAGEARISTIFEGFTSTPHYPLDERYEFQLDSRIECLTKFLASGPHTVVSKVVAGILDGLRKYVLRGPGMWSTAVVSHVGSLLHFSARLCLICKFAASEFMSAGVLSIIELLWTHAYHSPGRPSHKTHAGFGVTISPASHSMTSVQIGCVMLIGGIYTHLGRYVTRAVASGPSPFWFIHPCPEDTSGDTTEPPATSLYHHLAAYEDDYHIQSLTMELIELFVKNCDHHDIKTHVYLHKFVFETLGERLQSNNLELRTTASRIVLSLIISSAEKWLPVIHLLKENVISSTTFEKAAKNFLHGYLGIVTNTEIGRRDPPCDQWFYNNVTGAARVFTSTPGGILAFKSRTTQDSNVAILPPVMVKAGFRDPQLSTDAQVKHPQSAEDASHIPSQGKNRSLCETIQLALKNPAPSPRLNSKHTDASPKDSKVKSRIKQINSTAASVGLAVPHRNVVVGSVQQPSGNSPKSRNSDPKPSSSKQKLEDHPQTVTDIPRIPTPPKVKEESPNKIVIRNEIRKRKRVSVVAPPIPEAIVISSDSDDDQPQPSTSSPVQRVTKVASPTASHSTLSVKSLQEAVDDLDIRPTKRPKVEPNPKSRPAATLTTIRGNSFLSRCLQGAGSLIGALHQYSRPTTRPTKTNTNTNKETDSATPGGNNH
ncbi:hypothetical protein NLI96_g7223 [Meripilus lineatus]|uniref:Uncharacterized protein n=1 Tax=Meripilus lineatus TaxID=2056292 RepID=A0AAD5YHE1_9APHY|nr:hypothetical protein NLI96_g7223 [Physisporinus lineatus]